LRPGATCGILHSCILLGSGRLRLFYSSKKAGVILKELLELFIAFARVGVMTFGGGYAMLPMLQRELVDTRGWVTEEDLMDYFAIGQCTPGIIAVNVATFVGQKRRGTIGAIVASLGIVFPSVVIISVLAGIIVNLSGLPWVQNAFAGIRACVCVQIFNAVLKLAKKALVDPWTAALFVLVFILSMVLDVSPVVFVLLSGTAGVIIHALGLQKGGKKA